MREAEQAMRVYIRLPAPGSRCPFTGLSRTTLNNLILPNTANGHRPLVASKILKGRYAKRGIRLIRLRSLLDYLDALPSGDVVADEHQFHAAAMKPN